MSNSNEILQKFCRCELIKWIENFNKDKSRKDGVCPQCITCREDFYFKNLDKIKKYNEQKKTKKKHMSLKQTRNGC